MRLFDFACPNCHRIETDVHVPAGTAVDVWCLGCDTTSDPEYTRDVRMHRQLSAPPQIWHTHGRGGQ